MFFDLIPGVSKIMYRDALDTEFPPSGHNLGLDIRQPVGY